MYLSFLLLFKRVFPSKRTALPPPSLIPADNELKGIFDLPDGLLLRLLYDKYGKRLLVSAFAVQKLNTFFRLSLMCFSGSYYVVSRVFGPGSDCLFTKYNEN